MAHNNPSSPGKMNKVIKQRDTNRDHVTLPQNIPLHHPPSLPSCRIPKHHRHPATSAKCHRHAYSSHRKLRRNPATTFPLDLGVVATQLHRQRIPLKHTSLLPNSTTIHLHQPLLLCIHKTNTQPSL